MDRFAQTLGGVRERLGYLLELGVNHLHLMPLLHARPEPDDGGYAVADYGVNEHVFGLWREHAGARPLMLANFSEEAQAVPLALLHERNLRLDLGDALAGGGRPLRTHHDQLVLEPYQYAWLRG